MSFSDSVNEAIRQIERASRSAIEAIRNEAQSAPEADVTPVGQGRGVVVRTQYSPAQVADRLKAVARDQGVPATFLDEQTGRAL